MPPGRPRSAPLALTGPLALALTLALAVALAGLLTPAPASARADAGVRIGAVDRSIGDDRVVTVRLRCTGKRACAGSARLTSKSTTSQRSTATLRYSVRAGRTARVALRLRPGQLARLAKTGSLRATIKVRQQRPAARVLTRVVTLTPAAAPQPNPQPQPQPQREYSIAYRERNWTPTSYDTCTAALHASYQAVGPDGKIYPTWHPAQVVDPATGELCTFGHEHGTDPATSDLYDWVTDFYSPEAGTAQGLPFGYVSEALADYGDHHEGMAMRHEDNGGHKVFVANDVQLLTTDRDWLLDPAGEPVVCDYLIKQHQGSWSPDATSNNAHESYFATRCTDGTELISTSLTRFGNANEFHRSCSPATAVTTVGSHLPNGTGGRRIIPDAGCVTAHATGGAASQWGIYELWESNTEITAADGTVLAFHDPWFGVRNPSRYYDPAHSTATANGVSRTLDLAWGANPATAHPWSLVSGQEPFDWRDPRSPFSGSQRDFYLNQSFVSGEVSSPTLYTDPYGGNATTKPGHGLIAQHLVPGSATGTAALASQKLDANADHAKAADGTSNGVHAPN